MAGLVLEEIAVDGCITKAPGGGQGAGRSPVDRGEQGLKRTSMIDGYGIPLDRVLAGANRHDSPLLADASGQHAHRDSHPWNRPSGSIQVKCGEDYSGWVVLAGGPDRSASSRALHTSVMSTMPTRPTSPTTGK